jgi:SRSO17 transposase
METFGMDADTILELKPELTRFLHEFDDCFGRRQTRGHLATYVQGQLGDLPRKSVEPMADAAGMPPRTLQEFLSLSRWDEPRLRDRLQQRVARHYPHAHSVGILDETSFVKKGDKTACVQRQHCGAAGKTENCVVSVHLGYATPDFHTLLDGELYLPEKTWDQDPDRRREAGVPDEVSYRPKWQIALEQRRRAVGNGIRLRWMTFDEGYGGKPPFLRELDALGQDYVAEVPRSFHVWTQRPEVLHRRHARDMHKPGRRRRFPRLKAKNNPTVTVENVLRHSPLLRRQPWVTYRVKDGTKGPMVWEVKHLLVYLKDERGLPAGGGRAYHLLIARNMLNPAEVKYFLSNAGEATAVSTLLLVAFSRWKIERMFEDSKMELGLDHFEVRKYQSIQRHLLLSCVSHLFLAEFHQRHAAAGGATSGGGEKKDADDQPGGHGDQPPGAALGLWRPLLASPGGNDQRANRDNTTAQRQGGEKPPQANDPQITQVGHQPENLETMSMAENVAL